MDTLREMIKNDFKCFEWTNIRHDNQALYRDSLKTLSLSLSTCVSIIRERFAWYILITLTKGQSQVPIPIYQCRVGLLKHLMHIGNVEYHSL